jgi:hypothetical protein
MTKAKLESLLTALRATKKDSRELDAEIAILCRYHPYGPGHWITHSAYSCLMEWRCACGNEPPP